MTQKQNGLQKKNTLHTPTIQELADIKQDNAKNYEEELSRISGEQGFSVALQLAADVERYLANKPFVSFHFFKTTTKRGMRLNPVAVFERYTESRPLTLGLAKINGLQKYVEEKTDFSEVQEQLTLMSKMSESEADKAGYEVVVQ